MSDIQNQTKQYNQTKYENALPYSLKIKFWNNTEVHFRSYLQLKKTKMVETQGNKKGTKHIVQLYYLTMTINTYILSILHNVMFLFLNAHIKNQI